MKLCFLPLNGSSILCSSVAMLICMIFPVSIIEPPLQRKKRVPFKADQPFTMKREKIHTCQKHFVVLKIYL